MFRINTEKSPKDSHLASNLDLCVAWLSVLLGYIKWKNKLVNLGKNNSIFRML